MLQLLKLEENTKLKLETSCGRSITFTNSVPINDTETEDDTDDDFNDTVTVIEVSCESSLYELDQQEALKIIAKSYLQEVINICCKTLNEL